MIKKLSTVFGVYCSEDFPLADSLDCSCSISSFQWHLLPLPNNRVNFTEQLIKSKYILKLVHDFTDLVENMKCDKGVQNPEKKIADISEKQRQKHVRPDETQENREENEK